MSEFSSYKVGYIGDYAGVTMVLDQPIVSNRRETFNVLTRSQVFSRESLAGAIREAFADQHSSDLKILLNAHQALSQFIAEKGLTNAYSEADWENYSLHGSGCHTLELT